jgi:hypothetical protein
METIFVSREEIDALAYAMSLKGRSNRAVVHLKRGAYNGTENVLHYRHATGVLWWPLPTDVDIHSSGASILR